MKTKVLRILDFERETVERFRRFVPGWGEENQNITVPFSKKFLKDPSKNFHKIMNSILLQKLYTFRD